MTGVHTRPANIALPHHDGSPLYVSTLAPALGDAVRVRLRIPRSFGAVDSVRMRSNPDHEPRFARRDRVPSASTAGLVAGRGPRREPGARLPLPVQLRDGVAHAGSTRSASRRTETLDAEDFKLARATRSRPRGAGRRVMYQVFPDRFARSSARRRPRAARLGGAGAVGRRADPHRAVDAAPVLRRRPRRHRASTSTTSIASA